MTLARRLQITALLACGTGPALIAMVMLLAGGGEFPPRELRVFSLFPAPVVFTSPLYGMERKLELRYRDGTVESLGQSDAFLRNSGLAHRWHGVALWHFFRHSPRWPDEAARRALRVLFCRHAADFRLRATPDSVAYLIDAGTGPRRLEVACPAG